MFHRGGPWGHQTFVFHRGCHGSSGATRHADKNHYILLAGDDHDDGDDATNDDEISVTIFVFKMIFNF